MPRITLTVSSTGGNIPAHINTEHVILFQESIATNRPGTYIFLPTAATGMVNPLFVEETYQEILEKEAQSATSAK